MTEYGKYDVVIVGAGASGLLTAYETARNNKKVLIIELKDEPGKKIYATGNGRGNITNKIMNADCYYSNNKEFVKQIIDEYDYDFIKKYFTKMGLLLDEAKDYVYPYSKQASTIVKVIVNKLQAMGVEFSFDSNVKRIDENVLDNNKIDSSISDENNDGYEKENARFTVTFNKKVDKDFMKFTVYARNVVVAAGGSAAPKLGSDGSGFYLLKRMGHTVSECYPALVPLVADRKHINTLSKIKGVRCNAIIYAKDIGMSKGELQLTDYGLSGIAVFQLSGAINRKLNAKKHSTDDRNHNKHLADERNESAVEVYVDFIPDYEEDYLKTFIFEQVENGIDVKDTIKGMINDKIADMIFDEIKLDNDVKKSVSDIVACLKKYQFEITGTKGFDVAQVTTGGVDVNEITYNMESKLHKGLYITGEVINVDGICGGYNLHFAFVSGIIAGKSVD